MASDIAESTDVSCRSWLLSVSNLSVLWKGAGVNHVGEHFSAEFVIRPLFEGTGFLLWFRARGSDGTIYHEDVSLVGFDSHGREAMASVSTNIPYLQSFTAKANNASKIGRFEVCHGDVNDVSVFRERVSLESVDEHTIRYNFAWGMPGEEVLPRSSAALHPAPETPPSDAKI